MIVVCDSSTLIALSAIGQLGLLQKRCENAELVIPKAVWREVVYPNSHPEGAPFDHYGPLQSEEAIRYAREIIEFVRNKMA